MQSGLLLVLSHVDRPLENEFNRWYEQEHIPERMQLQGFVRAQRFKKPDEGAPQYLALYDLENTHVLDEPAYHHLRGSGRTAWATGILARIPCLLRWEMNLESAMLRDGLPDASAVFLMLVTVQPSNYSAFKQWFSRDYLPVMKDCPEMADIRWYSDRHHDNTVAIIHYLQNPDTWKNARIQEYLTTANVGNYLYRVSESVLFSYFEKLGNAWLSERDALRSRAD